MKVYLSDILYDSHSLSAEPRNSTPPIGLVTIIVGREVSKTLFFSCVGKLQPILSGYHYSFLSNVTYRISI